MARIRTIKPEFQQSESMGRVSREARLAFILLWPQCDDLGRIRGKSRMLASILFPYDEDAPDRIDGWLSELEAEGCIVRYEDGGAAYIAVCKWHHQKIDRPSPSKFPAPPAKSSGRKQRVSTPSPREPSSKDREPSLLDQGSRIKEGIEDQGEDQSEEAPSLRSAPPLHGEILPPSQPDLLPTGTPLRAQVRAIRAGEGDDLGKAVELYNTGAARIGWPICSLPLDGQRRRDLVARLQEHGLPGWTDMLRQGAESAFLRGENDRRWCPPGLGWFAKRDNFTKVREGAYRDRAGGRSNSALDRVAQAATYAAANGGGL